MSIRKAEKGEGDTGKTLCSIGGEQKKNLKRTLGLKQA